MRYPTRQAPRATRRAAAIAIAAIAHQLNPRSRERVGSGRRHTHIARGATADPKRQRSRRMPADADAGAGAGAEIRVVPPRGAHVASPRVKALSKAALAAVKADAAKPKPTTKAGRKYRAERNAKLRERAAAKASAKAAADEDRDALRAIVGRRLRLRLPDEDARRMCRIVDFDARTGAYRVRYDEGDEADAHLERADIRFVACAKVDADVRRALRVAGKKRFQFESANASIDAKDETAKKAMKAKNSDDVEGTRRMTEAEGTPKARTNSERVVPERRRPRRYPRRRAVSVVSDGIATLHHVRDRRWAASLRGDVRSHRRVVERRGHGRDDVCRNRRRAARSRWALLRTSG